MKGSLGRRLVNLLVCWTGAGVLFVFGLNVNGCDVHHFNGCTLFTVLGEIGDRTQSLDKESLTC